MSAKNNLQEICQKNGYDFPKYESEIIGGEDHTPIWITTVTLYNDKIYQSSPKKSKKDSEAEAAAKAYNDIINIGDCSSPSSLFPMPIVNNKKNIKLKKKTVLLIDIENQGNAIKELCKKYNRIENISIFVFIAAGNPALKKIREIFEELKKIVKNDTSDIQFNPARIIEVPSSRSDSADIGLILSMAELKRYNYYDYYIILSNDHILETLTECLDKFDLQEFRKNNQESLSPSPLSSFQQIPSIESRVNFSIKNIDDLISKFAEIGILA